MSKTSLQNFGTYPEVQGLNLDVKKSFKTYSLVLRYKRLREILPLKMIIGATKTPQMFVFQIFNVNLNGAV